MHSERSLAAATAGVVGDGLGILFGGLATIRAKPLHPRGVVVNAELERTGVAEPFGVAWLDEPGTDVGFVRLSRSLGLPEGWLDVLGLSFHWEDDTGAHDLLLATTGTSPVARSVLVPRRNPHRSTYGSLFPYRTPRGAVVILATPDAGQPRSFRVSVAGMLGGRQDFGRLRLADRPAIDMPIELDPVRHPLPDLPLVPIFAALREPAYAAARRVRRAA